MELIKLAVAIALLIGFSLGGVLLLLGGIRFFFRWLDSGWFIPRRPKIRIHRVEETLPAIGGAVETRH